MSLADYQFSYNGVVCGHGTAYEIASWEGVRSLPDLKTADTPKMVDDGDFPGVDAANSRTITVSLIVNRGGTLAALEAALAALEAATPPRRSGTLPYLLKLPNQGQRRTEARVRKRSAILTPTYKVGWQKVDLMFYSPDPRLYDDTLTTTVIAGSGSITNAGGYDSRPTVTVTPSAGTVTIVNTSDSSKQVVLAGAVPSPCVVDLQARTVVDGSGANRFDVVDTAATTWPVLQPGVNALTIAGGSMSVAWRSAWL